MTGPRRDPPAGPTLGDDLRMGLRLVRGLPGYLRHPLTAEKARAVLRLRLERREDDFLDVAKRAIFDHPPSPYLPLLRAAGCEYGDLERLVRSDGLESALKTLYRRGVYLTTDESKGRRAAVRGATTVEAGPGRLRNPLAAGHYWVSTSGSRGASTQLPMDLACIRDRAVNMLLGLQARGGAGWRKAIWMLGGISPLLWYSGGGRPVERWFSPLDVGSPRVSPRYRWSARGVAWAGLLSGTRLPRPEPVPVTAPLPIARWMERVLRGGGVPHLWAFPSAAARLCREAQAAGIGLRGSQLTVTGEPVTEAALGVIRDAGVAAVPDYGSADSGGSAAQGCLAPEAADDVHVFSDLNALIQAEGPPFPAGALLLTSIRSTTPFIYLNASLGDRAVMTERRCGCPMEEMGWKTHLSSIRSYEKLTAGGMNFADTDLIRVLDEALPRRFGGAPGDYQLVEDLPAGGPPRVRLFVSPSVPPADPGVVRDFFLEALGRNGGPERTMSLQIREAGLLSVVRRKPVAGAAGKVLHLWAGEEPDHDR